MIEIASDHIRRAFQRVDDFRTVQEPLDATPIEAFHALCRSAVTTPGALSEVSRWFKDEELAAAATFGVVIGLIARNLAEEDD
jgi:hypothetical protein